MCDNLFPNTNILHFCRSPKLVGKFSNQNVITVNNNSPRKRSLFVVSDEMIEATSATCDNLGHANTSDLSPCSDFTDDSIEEDKDPLSLEDDQRSITQEVEELDQDADSLDEGVGDISSDGELSPGLRERASLVLNSSCETPPLSQTDHCDQLKSLRLWENVETISILKVDEELTS